MNGVGDECACTNPIVAVRERQGGPLSLLEGRLLSHITLTDFGARSGNAMWGCTNPETGREIAVVGLDNGTAFVDVTSPRCAKIVGMLPTASSRSVSRDVKAQDHHALVVAEAANHGMQIFDLRTLPAASDRHRRARRW